MKKSVFAISAILALSMSSCIGDSQPAKQEAEQPDKALEQKQDSIIEVAGIALDGAKNSVELLVGEDTLTFEYPDLDVDHRQIWAIGDSVKVRYYVTESGDSITDVINESVG